jgi:hypothetical protein
VLGLSRLPGLRRTEAGVPAVVATAAEADAAATAVTRRSARTLQVCRGDHLVGQWIKGWMDQLMDCQGNINEIRSAGVLGGVQQCSWPGVMAKVERAVPSTLYRLIVDSCRYSASHWCGNRCAPSALE